MKDPEFKDKLIKENLQDKYKPNMDIVSEKSGEYLQS